MRVAIDTGQHRMKYILLFFVILGFSLPLKAQDAAKPTKLQDSLDHKKDTVRHAKDSTYHVTLNSTGSINKVIGDVTYLFNNDLKFGLKKKSVTVSFENSWIYGIDHNVQTNNDYSSVLQFDLYKTIPHFYYWGLANYNTSYSLKIHSQALAGAGLAYSVLDRKNAYLNFSDGLVFDQSNLILPDSTHLVYHTMRNSFRINFKFSIKGIFEIDGSDFFQNSFTDGQDYIIRSTTSLSLKLTNWLDLTSSFNFNEQKRTESSNLIFTYGLKLDRYF
jgi:hypothetical protein